MSHYYDTLKSKNEIMQVAFALNYDGSKSGSSYQGNCPKHASQNGKCLVIWPRGQRFKCFHCGAKGDVINLVQLFMGLDHVSAVNYLAKRVGIAPLESQGLSPQEMQQAQAEIEERGLVEEILTVAAGWYHQQLDHFPDIVNHLRQHYGFSQEIIEELQIGFAPPGTSHPEITSDLAEYLNSFPSFVEISGF